MQCYRRLHEFEHLYICLMRLFAHHFGQFGALRRQLERRTEIATHKITVRNFSPMLVSGDVIGLPVKEFSFAEGTSHLVVVTRIKESRTSQ